MSIFAELLSIKEFRESQAELAVKKAQAEQSVAHREHEELRTALDAFREEARSQEQRWYSQLCKGPVKLREINDVRENVAGLREGERQREASTDKAAQALATAMDRTSAARSSLRQATAVKDKFVELATNMAEEAARDLQRKEDAEMEEASSGRPERRDWEHSGE